MSSLQTRGIIQEIHETKEYPKKDGSGGNVYVTKLKIDDKYFTYFRPIGSDFEEGDVVDVTYTEKENEYEGKVYVNNNISVLKRHEEKPAPISPKNWKETEYVQVKPLSQQLSQQPQKSSHKVNLVTIGDKTYKVTFEEVK